MMRQSAFFMRVTHIAHHFLGLPVLMVGTVAIVVFKLASSMAESSFKPALNSSLFLTGLPKPSRRFFNVAICAYSSLGMVKLSRSILTLLVLALSFSVSVAVLLTTLIAGAVGTFFATTGGLGTIFAADGFVAAGFATAVFCAAGLATTGFVGVVVFTAVEVVLFADKGLAPGLLAMNLSC
ncbi:hypothetical protein [Methylophilus sp.]|uniref:hypothetical protein n=1 Tax=Methylophilus sp. TaxID=29541 RepID=UPI00338FCF15